MTTSNCTNIALPATVQPGSKFDIRLSLASDYFFLPSTLEVAVLAKVKIQQNDGTLRNVEAKDGLCPSDGLNFIKNARPVFDQNQLIPTAKEINQKLFRRALDLATRSNDKAMKKVRIQDQQEYFEEETVADNSTGKTHSHKYKDNTVEFYDPGDANSSAQNTNLALQLKDEFVCKVRLSNIAPFDIGKIYTRPLTHLDLSLEICALHEWLRLVCPDGTAGSVVPSVNIFSSIVLQITGVKFSYTQVALNDKLFDLYFKATAMGKISSTSHSLVDYHPLTNPIPKASNSWTYTIYNTTIPDRFLFLFHTAKNLLKADGNYYFFSNPAMTSMQLRVTGTSINRYNQNRTTSWISDKDIIVSSKAEYDQLKINQKRVADLANNDLIIAPNRLFAGASVGELAEKNFITDLSSIYNGHAIYTFNTSVQTEINTLLKESTKRGNCSFTMDFARPTKEIYYMTIFAIHNGEFFRYSDGSFGESPTPLPLKVMEKTSVNIGSKMK